MMTKCLIIIPSRLAAVRLPNKPLADIGGKPMLLHCYERAIDADIGNVLIAAGDQEIHDMIKDNGGDAILTDPELPSGSDRIAAALQKYDRDGVYQHIINLQGDLPFIKSSTVKACGELILSNAQYDITTLASVIKIDAQRHNPNVVKAICAIDARQESHEFQHAKALYFTRASSPYERDGDDILLEHLGIYAYQRQALEKFIALPPSYLEQREKLEQLRALEAGLHIEIGLVDDNPIAIDTADDLQAAREYYQEMVKK